MFTKADVDHRLVDALTIALKAVERMRQANWKGFHGYDNVLVGEFSTTLRRELLPTSAPWKEVARLLSNRSSWATIGKLSFSEDTIKQGYRLELADGTWTLDLPRLFTMAQLNAEGEQELEVDLTISLRQLELALNLITKPIAQAKVINDAADVVSQQLATTLATLEG